jgi:hypothetical protein
MTRHDESARSRNDAVLAEHRAIREILRRMRTATARDDLGARLAEFCTAARDHFDGEEAEGGFYDSVLAQAPRHQAVIDALRDEHGSLLRDAERLRLEVSAAAETDLARLCAVAGGLADRLEEHEATENEILLEVMNQDLGAGD